MNEPLDAAAKNTPLKRAASIAALVRDVGVILGFPALLTIGAGLYQLQEKALEAQIKSNEAQIKAVEAQNALLKETQYDRALSLIKSQKEIFVIERQTLEKKIADLTAAGVPSEEIAKLKPDLELAVKKLDITNHALTDFQRCAGLLTSRYSMQFDQLRSGIGTLGTGTLGTGTLGTGTSGTGTLNSGLMGGGLTGGGQLTNCSSLLSPQIK